MYRTAAIFLLACAPIQAVLADPFAYVCKSDLAVGYRFDEASRNWVPDQFKANNTFIIRSLTQEEMARPFVYPKNSKWGVFEPGIKTPSFYCPEPNELMYMTCGAHWYSFSFNGTALRYQQNYNAGFIDGHDNNDNTPSIEIGRCRRMGDG